MSKEIIENYTCDLCGKKITKKENDSREFYVGMEFASNGDVRGIKFTCSGYNYIMEICHECICKAIQQLARDTKFKI